MIATRNEIKTLLQLTDNTYDSFIEANIPLIDQIICDYCNNDFIDTEFDYFSSTEISFDNTDNSINFTGIGDKDLIATDTIRVYKSLRNNQLFTVDTVNSNSIIVNCIDNITDEDAGEGIFIAKVTYPKSLKMVVAKMIKYLIAQLSEDEVGIKTEKIDDYSVTYIDDISGFPSSIMKSLNNYRHVYKCDLFTGNRGA